MKFKNYVIDFSSFSHTAQEPASIVKDHNPDLLAKGQKNQIMVYARPGSIPKCSTIHRSTNSSYQRSDIQITSFYQKEN